jgi:hypothetical protein
LLVAGLSSSQPDPGVAGDSTGDCTLVKGRTGMQPRFI